MPDEQPISSRTFAVPLKPNVRALVVQVVQIPKLSALRLKRAVEGVDCGIPAIGSVLFEVLKNPLGVVDTRGEFVLVIGIMPQAIEFVFTEALRRLIRCLHIITAGHDHRVAESEDRHKCYFRCIHRLIPIVARKKCHTDVAHPQKV